MFSIKGDNGPYYIDCEPVAGELFERAPGSVSLICDEGSDIPVRFDTENEAVDFVLAKVPENELRQFKWTLISAQVLIDAGHSIESDED